MKQNKFKELINMFEKAIEEIRKYEEGLDEEEIRHCKFMAEFLVTGLHRPYLDRGHAGEVRSAYKSLLLIEAYLKHVSEEA